MIHGATIVLLSSASPFISKNSNFQYDYFSRYTLSSIIVWQLCRQTGSKVYHFLSLSICLHNFCPSVSETKERHFL